MNVRRKGKLKRTFWKRILLFVLFFLFLPCIFPPLPSCEEKPAPAKNLQVTRKSAIFTEKGLFLGIGSGSLPEGHYSPFVIIGHFGVDLKRLVRLEFLKGHEGSMTVFVEPQFSYVSERGSDFEYGIGLGLQYKYPFLASVHGYILGVIGPHYISVVTQEQANGFVFSESLGVGVYMFVGENSAINIGYRIRHMSNAGLSRPNGGIDAHFAIVGYSVFF